MLELPESFSISKQLNETIIGKVVDKVHTNSSPHRFAWYFDDHNKYQSLLENKQITSVRAVAGQVEISAENMKILFSDGINIRYIKQDDPRPKKHQLLIEFKDGSALSGSVQMYGGLWVFLEGTNNNPYYLIALEKPSPLTNEFTEYYFKSLLKKENLPKMSAKAFLTTNQRIPGLGNGVSQDILFNANIHPKAKMDTLSKTELHKLYESIKNTLYEMATNGGRDTEKDIYGNPCGYKTKLSNNTNGKPCSVCGEEIKKESYMGGSIYYCSNCQKL